MRLLRLCLLVLVAVFLVPQAAYADWVSIPEPTIHQLGSNNIQVDFDPVVVTSVCCGPNLWGFSEIQSATTEICHAPNEKITCVDDLAATAVWGSAGGWYADSKGYVQHTVSKGLSFVYPSSGSGRYWFMYRFDTYWNSDSDTGHRSYTREASITIPPLTKEEKEKVKKGADATKLVGSVTSLLGTVCTVVPHAYVKGACWVLSVAGAVTGVAGAASTVIADNDPPDPNYQVLPKVIAPKLAKTQPKGALTRKVAQRLDAYLANAVRAAALNQAILQSYERFSGAANAASGQWEQAQLAAMRGFSGQLAAVLRQGVTIRAQLLKAWTGARLPKLAPTKQSVQKFRSAAPGLKRRLIGLGFRADLVNKAVDAAVVAAPKSRMSFIDTLKSAALDRASLDMAAQLDRFAHGK